MQPGQSFGFAHGRLAPRQYATQVAAHRYRPAKNAKKSPAPWPNASKRTPLYTPAFGNLLGIVGPEDTTDISALKPEICGEDKKGGVVEIDFNLANSEGVNIYSRRDGDTDFKFLARDNQPAPPCRAEVGRRRMLFPGKPELREYKAVFVVGDVEVSQLSDEITVKCAPLV